MCGKMGGGSGFLIHLQAGCLDESLDGMSRTYIVIVGCEITVGPAQSGP